jgi:hypothetical protein
MKNFLYIRGLRRAEHTVFTVADGQKTYWDQQFNRELAYSSGQQVKRSILDALVNQLGKGRAPVQFQYKLQRGKTTPGEDIALQQMDPQNEDELIGGWMRATGKGAQKSEDDYGGVIKRRSPLSISAMRPLHPLLSKVDTEESMTFDRSDDGNSSVRLLDLNGNVMSHDDMINYLRENDIFLRKAKYVDSRNQKRAYGFFVYDIAIDLRRLFSVSIDETQPEIDPNRIESLIESGWREHTNAFGKSILAPQTYIDNVLPALSDALVEWQITSNQSRTYSPMETLAIAVSDKANEVNASIRSRLETDDNGKYVATPVLDKTVGNLFIYVTAESYIAGISASSSAIDDAKAFILNQLKNFNYETQLT